MHKYSVILWMLYYECLLWEIELAGNQGFIQMGHSAVSGAEAKGRLWEIVAIKSRAMLEYIVCLQRRVDGTDDSRATYMIFLWQVLLEHLSLSVTYGHNVNRSDAKQSGFSYRTPCQLHARQPTSEWFVQV